MQADKPIKGENKSRERKSWGTGTEKGLLRLGQVLGNERSVTPLPSVLKIKKDQPLKGKFIPLDEVKLSQVTDLRTAETMWRSYSRFDNVWDLWEFRRVFIDVYKYPIMFVVATWKSNIVGVLPLWFDQNQGHYEWISGWWSEQGRPFCNDSGIVLKMLESISGKISLECMTPETALLFNGLVEPDSDHFGLDLNEVGGTWEGYLGSLKKKKRYNIKRDIKQVLARRPVVRYDNGRDLEHLFRLNIARMDKKAVEYEDESKSVFDVDIKQKESFIELWKRRGGKYDARIICIEIDGEVVSCDFNLIYRKKYYTLLGGLDVDRVSGIGSFANMLDIQDGISNGCTYIDFCMEDHHWKHTWFKADPMFRVVCPR